MSPVISVQTQNTMLCANKTKHAGSLIPQNDFGGVDEGCECRTELDQAATSRDINSQVPSLRSNQAQLTSPDIISIKNSHSSTSDPSPGPGLKWTGSSEIAQTKLSHANLDRPRRSSSSLRDSSDLSDLSDVSGLSDLEEGERTVSQESSKAQATQNHGHRPDILPLPRNPLLEKSKSQRSQWISPRSKQDNFVHAIPRSTEESVVKSLREHSVNKATTRTSLAFDLPLDTDVFIEFELSDFSIYLPDNKHHPFAMRGLQHLGTKPAHITYLFDGILSMGGEKYYVQDVPFKLRSIGNYGEDLHEVGDNIWIQSEANTRTNIFYRLGKPSAEYTRFHDDFLWLADLAKHFVDYLEASGYPVSIHKFRKDFYQWLEGEHSISPTFSTWFDKYGREDFRSAVTVNIAFLFAESMGIDPELKSHPIWREVMSRDSVPFQEIEEEETIVTPYVYECFKELRFGHHLKVVPSMLTNRDYQPTKSVDAPSADRQQNGNLPSQKVPMRFEPIVSAVERVELIGSIKAGDVLSVTKDGYQSVWKDEASRWKAADDCWYVYVQKVRQTGRGKPTYDAIWMYKPSDTSCAKMKYPYPKELFMSDNCTCLKARIAADEVLGIVPVKWNGETSDTSYFVRQTYLQNERFVTLEESHKTCEHLRAKLKLVLGEPQHKYPIGTTILVPPQHKSKYGLEAYEIDSYVTEPETLKQTAVLRRLLRRQDIDNTGEKNELVYTDQMEVFPTNKLQRTCLVRFYGESDVADQKIPAPYNRKGNGNAFYITSRLIETNGKTSLKPMQPNTPKRLIQGFDPLDRPPRTILNGLDLFCGGGNFGRGLEEGGAVCNKWAVDIDKNAIHTYSLNVDESIPTKLFYGSVNDMLAQAMKGNPKNSDLIPLPGEVDFISAGSPCQGFSNLNVDQHNEKGLRNQSLSASVAAYVDFYRPKYGVLENVLSMTQRGRGRDEDVMSQLICAVVGLGYQVRLDVLDAWSCGSPQSRGRLFLTFAAPGLVPMDHPELSHSHPPHAVYRGLGKLANGQAFGARRAGPTPFEWVTIEEGLAGLPVLGDGATYQCIPYPDHVLAKSLTEQLRSRLEVIPTHPRGMNFYKSWKNGKGSMTIEDRALFPPLHKRDGTMRSMYKPDSKAYTRVSPKSVYPCMTLHVCPGDIRMGSGIHWDEQRTFTAMEGRRIQDVPDHEVFLGSPAEVWKILGNSVNRNVSLALGLSLRDAWLANDPANCRGLEGSKVVTALPESIANGSGTLANKSKATGKAGSIRQSTGRGVCAKGTTPNLPDVQSENSSGEDSSLTEWTYNLMMSLDLMESTQQDKDTNSNNEESASNAKQVKKSLKRPHVAFQDMAILPNEKSCKLTRGSEKLKGTSTTMRHTNGEISKLRSSESSALRDTSVASGLQEVARESHRQIHCGHNSNDDDEPIENIAEVAPSSSASRSFRRIPKRKKPPVKRPSRAKQRNPIIISLLSDDEDGEIEVVLQSHIQHQRQLSNVLQARRQTSRGGVAMSPSDDSWNDQGGNSRQRRRLPSARPIRHTHTSERIPHPRKPPPIDTPDEEHQQTSPAAERSEHPGLEAQTPEIDEAVGKRNVDERGEAERETREVVNAEPVPKYVAVDNDSFMPYFQTSRYMGKKSGRAR